MTISDLAHMLENRINMHLTELAGLGHAYKLASILKETNKIDSLLIKMKKEAKQLEPVIFFVKAQSSSYGELIEALLRK